MQVLYVYIYIYIYILRALGHMLGSMVMQYTKLMPDFELSAGVQGS